MSEPLDNYEMPWRPNYEATAAVNWAAAAAVALTVGAHSSLPNLAFTSTAVLCGGLCLWRGAQAYRLFAKKRRLFGRRLPFISHAEILRWVKKNPGKVLLGYGFKWEQRHTQATHEILKRDRSAVIPTFDPLATIGAFALKALGKSPAKARPGALWLQGLERTDQEIVQSTDAIDLHMLVVGTTGAGKTRLLDLIVSQAIARQEAVIILDPKGDKDLANLARQMCEFMGQPERYVYWHPGFAEHSVRINPLYSFGRGTEVASRIAALIGSSDGGADPFRDFAQRALNNVAQSLILNGDRPTFLSLKKFLEGGVAELVIKSITNWSVAHLDGAADALERIKAGGDSEEKRARAFIGYYKKVVAKQFPNADLEGLLSQYEHDAAHFGKMIASLLPLLAQLTSGDLASLLSPDPTDMEDNRRITDTANIIDQGQVAYIGLDSLSDGIVGSAVGSIMLADLASVAGRRYNYGEGIKPVNVIVDEAAEIVCAPFIQILNKGRGAKIRTVIATQTIADFTVKLGSEHQMRQVLGNVNTVVSLRVRDSDTQEYVVSNLPKTSVKSMTFSHGARSQSSEIQFQGMASQSLGETEVDAFPPPLLGEIPTLETLIRTVDGSLYKGILPITTGKQK